MNMDLGFELGTIKKLKRCDLRETSALDPERVTIG
jgi:hypothetical protein